jgi:leucyl-tRNA synthetase
MIKKLVCACLLTLPLAGQNKPLQILSPLDQMGMLNDGVVNIMSVRERLKNFVNGSLLWKGIESQLVLIDAQGNRLADTLHVIVKRPEALCGATFVVIAAHHPQAVSLAIQSQKSATQSYISFQLNKKLLTRYQESNNYNAVNLGVFALNPLTQERMPVFLSDYILEGFDTRITHAHLAIPAHDQKDFEFAQKYMLPIKLVINSVEQGKASSPQYHKTTKELLTAYIGDYFDNIIVNSGSFNGPVHSAAHKVIVYLKERNIANEYQQPVIYQLGHKQYSLRQLQLMEMTLKDKTLSEAQKEIMQILMIQAHADFLGYVEQFLVNAREYKDVMVAAIEECFYNREMKDAYLLKWSRLQTTDPEKVVFKRDIITFTNLCKFCEEVFDFLSDFLISCPNAIANLQNLKNLKKI